MTTPQHPDTIGQIEWEGRTFDIDWPFGFDDPDKRDPYLAVIYENDVQLDELPLPGFGESFESEGQVMGIAFEYIAGGALDETEE